MPITSSASRTRVPLSMDAFLRIAFGDAKVKLQKDDLAIVERSHTFLKKFAKGKVIYGITTGFGPLAQQHITGASVEQLQYNLVRSHAAGAGEALPASVVRAMMMGRLNTFLLGYSGVSRGVVEQLTFFLNEAIHPVIPEHGGVGASGDLVQQAHMALALIGEGEVDWNGERCKASHALKKLGQKPLQLTLRDGLALVNGTACMTGVGALNALHGRILVDHSVLMGAWINELVEAYDDHLHEGLHAVRPHPGQVTVAQRMRNILKSGKLTRSRTELLNDSAKAATNGVFRDKVQEHYSIRCVPQIVGPVLELVDGCDKVITTELNSVDDNPIVDHRKNSVDHGGNFHGDRISLEMDILRLGMVKLCMLAERQLNFLLNDQLNKRFPPFLCSGTVGLDYAMQGLQFTATSITAECQAASTSLYVHSIPTNRDNQDVVSMGTNAARATSKVIRNTAQVMAIQLIALAQATDIAGVRKKLSKETGALYDQVRAITPMITTDVPLNLTVQQVCSEVLIAELE